jgi:AraC family transcriptional regulator, regulatory protein of adaptative response / DNA-3-methyladenine glycosylase II
MARPAAAAAYTEPMTRDDRRFHRALAAKDPRFDGIFFVGVTSTGIYCRPICPARTTKAANRRFFDTAQQAEHAGFRPCLRCRPELAPGSAPVDDAQRIAQLIVQRLEEGKLDEQTGLDTIAEQFELSSRQIRRIVRAELGVPPIELLLTRRLLLAKQLLTETSLPITDIAFASGFSSLRRFNDAFSTRYGMPPTRFRKHVIDGAPQGVGHETLTLQLFYRPPYDWTGMLAFLSARALKGIEHVTIGQYARTVQIGAATGWLRVTQSQKKHALNVEFTHSLTPVLPALLRRVRALFDLNARPDVIAKHLARDGRLAAAVKGNPGLRVPGAFNGFEMGLRAILGQQVTVKGATTIAGRLVEALGEPIATPFPELHRLTPVPGRLAGASIDEIARHGIVAARAGGIIALAKAQQTDALCLDGGAHHRPGDSIDRLAQLPGIGSWTANYIAMRALRWPDAFPNDDIVVRRNLGGVTAKEAEALSQPWRPWRSYAVMHVWRMTPGFPAGHLTRDTESSRPEECFRGKAVSVRRMCRRSPAQRPAR